MIAAPEIREAFERGREAIEAGWTWKRGQHYIEYREDVDLLVCGLVTKVFDFPGDEMHGQPLHVSHHDGGFGTMGGVIVPDFRDPGTRGHLLDQVRKAFGEPKLGIRSQTVASPSGLWWGWVVDVNEGNKFEAGRGVTETAALLAARRAAP